MTDVAGRTVLITGAASGIGRLLADELAGRRARLVLWDIDDVGVQRAATELRRTGASAAAYSCDVGDRRAVLAAAERVLREVGPVDVLVNNAGVVSGRPLLELTDEQIETTFAVNTLSLFWTTRAFLPGMIERGSGRGQGHLVTVASAAGLIGVAGQTDYAASKHAAVGFDEALRAELRARAPAVRTTVVCPYYVATGMFAGVRSRLPWLLPILDPAYVARRVAVAIVRDERRVLIPSVVGLVPALRVLPVGWFDRLAGLLGVNATMQSFRGRRGAP